MLKVYKQQTYEGCLPACLMILANIKPSKQKELEIIYTALKKSRDNFYTLNNLTAFIEIYNFNASLYVDNLWFTKYLNEKSKNKNIKVLHQKLNQNYFKKVKIPFILYVDDYILGEESHSPHFIIVENIEDNLAKIIDPWRGIHSTISIETLLEASASLWKQFLYCPLLITLTTHNRGL